MLCITSEGCRRILTRLYKGMDPRTRGAEVQRFVEVYRGIRLQVPDEPPEIALVLAIKLEDQVAGKFAARMLSAMWGTPAFGIARAEMRLLERLHGTNSRFWTSGANAA